MDIKVQYFTSLDTVKSDVPNLWYINVSMYILCEKIHPLQLPKV